MMCCYSDAFSSQFCQNKATEILWCPTWVSADKGPQLFCPYHAKNFKPEFNPHAKGGQFFWGDDAAKAFKEIGASQMTKF